MLTKSTSHRRSLGALSIISNELANDLSPAAQTVVGESTARDLARKIDSAFFGDTVSNGPSGLESLTAYQFVDTDSVPLNQRGRILHGHQQGRERRRHRHHIRRQRHHRAGLVETQETVLRFE